MTDLNLSGGIPVINGGGTLAFATPQYANDGSTVTGATRGIHTGGGSDPVTLSLIADLGSSQSVSQHTLNIPGGGSAGNLWTGFADVVTIYSGTSTSGPWTLRTATTYTPATGTPHTLIYIHAAFSSRYWRLVHTRTEPGTLYSMPSVAVRTWAIEPSVPPAPVADFSADDTSPAIGQVVAFTDLTTNTPTSWAWTFGDGGTSTLQNPTHIYAAAGSYTVTLTATNAYGSDSETKVAYITIIAVAPVPEPVGPAGVLLEIYASAPGSARWDVAKWDEATWGEAGWRDVTPYGINVNITWGSNRPELGILSVPEAASWAVDYHDPDRVLDPSNESGPYFGDLVPDLPIRVSHRSTVIRQGYVTGISHNFKYPMPGWGYMRGTDNISRMANAQVPPDVDLADTLVARAIDAIAAAGLSVTVVPPLGADPAVSPWITGTREWSVWEWIKDAAQEVLYIPIIDRLNRLTFRSYASPLARARSLDSTEMIDLAVVTDYSGLYSVVQARVDDTTVTERALTPPPRYGARTYTRDEITIDAGDWAETVLTDRSFYTLLWKPGSIRPVSAVSTEALATIEAIERVSILLPEQSPAVIAAGIVVGGEVDIVGKEHDAAIWRFRYELAQTATEPLIETGGDPTDYLLRTGGGEYLYPTGGS